MSQATPYIDVGGRPKVTKREGNLNTKVDGRGPSTTFHKRQEPSQERLRSS